MKNILFAIILFGGIIITSCNNQPKEDKNTEAIAATTTDTVIKFTAAMVDGVVINYGQFNRRFR